ncbi:MAG: hypothetical protein H6717_41295 [Polyangiaceae bacterium]|nr:hypothetical protein [Polyangiaceae bacterium]
MPPTKAEMSKRDLLRRQQEAARDGLHFAVRHSFDGKPYNPPRFCRSLAEAAAAANVTFSRVNTADADSHPDDTLRSIVWVEHFSDGAWAVLDGTKRTGYFDTAKRRGQTRPG